MWREIILLALVGIWMVQAQQSYNHDGQEDTPPCPECSENTEDSIRSQRLPRGVGLRTLRYKYYGRKVSWFQASNTCTQDGGHLVIPKTKAQLEFLKKIMKKYNENLAVHVGFHDIQKEGTFISVLGDPLNDFQRTMWESDQPSGGRAENCAIIRHYGSMHDYKCQGRLAFVCELS